MSSTSTPTDVTANTAEAKSFLRSFLTAIQPGLETRRSFTDSGDPSRQHHGSIGETAKSFNAIVKFIKDCTGDAMLSLEGRGFVLTFDAPKSDVPVALPPLKASVTVEATDGRKALVYLATGDATAIAALRTDLEPLQGDLYTIGTDMPLPFGDWALDEADEAVVKTKGSFKVYDFGDLEKGFFLVEGDESDLNSDNRPEDEESLLSRIIDKLRNGNPNPAQRTALKMSGRGYYATPVNGIVKVKKSKELECLCQSGKRWYADKNRKPVEACISPGKHPMVSGWEDHNASRDPDVLMHLFDAKYTKRRSTAEDGLNIGFVTGPDTGLVVLDIDDLAELAKLEKEHGPLPATNRVTTGSGGLHIYFRSPDGVTILNSASKIAPKIDFRGEHGFVVAPPSRHKSGGSYSWQDGCSPDDIQLAAMPEWLIPLAIEGGEKEAAEKAAAKPGKGSAKKARTEGRRAAHGASSNADGWKGFLDEMGDHEGGRGFNGPGGEAMCSYFRKHGAEADATEFLEAYAVAFEKADKSKGGRDKYHPAHSYIAEQLEKARQKIRDTPQKEYAIGVDADGWVTIGDDNTRFCIAQHEGRDWIHTVDWAKDDEGNPVSSVGAPYCTLFKVVRIAKDGAGGSATITIEYETRHDGPRILTFPLALLYERAELLKLLRSNFFPMAIESGVIALFKELDLPINTLIVEEPGWKDDGGYLHFDGTYLPRARASDEEAKAPASPSYMLRTVPQEISGKAGTIEVWKEGIGRLFATEYENLEPFRFGAFTGGAGYIASLIDTQEVPEMNLGGETRHGKTTASMFGASVSASPARGVGVLRKCNGTANAMETEAVQYGGGTNYFDEAHLMDPDHFGDFRWRVAEGKTKARLRPDGTPRPTAKITGMSITTVEIGAIAYAESKGKKQPDGLRSRLVEISYDGITKLTGEAKDWIFGKVEKQGDDERVLVPGAVQMIKTNYGHAWRLIVEYLQQIGAARAAGEVEHYANLIDPKAEGVQRAQAKIVALVWYSAAIMKELGFLPDHVTDANIEAVIRWAWARRSEDSKLSPFNKAMVALLDNSMVMRGNAIVDVISYDERFSGERLGYSWSVTEGDLKGNNPETGVKKDEEWLCVPTKDGRLRKLCEATGKTDKGLVQQMEKLGLIVATTAKRKRLYFDRLPKMPKGKTLAHYRINLTKLAEYVRSLDAQPDAES